MPLRGQFCYYVYMSQFFKNLTNKIKNIVSNNSQSLKDENILLAKQQAESTLAQLYTNPLLFFYGDGCEHCKNEEAIVKVLAIEGVSIQKIEVWNNKENDILLEKLDCREDNCGGIPFFYNQKNKKTICGEATKEEVIEWAK